MSTEVKGLTERPWFDLYSIASEFQRMLEHEVKRAVDTRLHEMKRSGELAALLHQETEATSRSVSEGEI